MPFHPLHKIQGKHRGLKIKRNNITTEQSYELEWHIHFWGKGAATNGELSSKDVVSAHSCRHRVCLVGQ